MNLEYVLQKDDTGILNIYDMLGKRTVQYLLDQNSEKVIINADFLLSGIYFYEIAVNERIVFSNKLVIIK